MPLNTFSIGKDCQVVVLGPFGRVDLEHVTGFESRQITASVRVDRMDGTMLGAELPKGWDGSFDIERGSSAVDDLLAQIEQTYLSGGSVAPGTLYQYVDEVDGSTSTYQYNSVVFKLTSSGLYKGDASVKQKLEFYATSRSRVS
ncbi:hypothetical protein [Acidisoma cladoniae]|jgi:hypothetical protein|uniref:hypothetical protein n=1 Tax=Acidisoma cladoniae TaxID=3040935 RepID=UPI002550F9C5|nr:hypothetical protein [Acidisoma sp. PAMC 29798]